MSDTEKVRTYEALGAYYNRIGAFTIAADYYAKAKALNNINNKENR